MVLVDNQLRIYRLICVSVCDGQSARKHRDLIVLSHVFCRLCSFFDSRHDLHIRNRVRAAAYQSLASLNGYTFCLAVCQRTCTGNQLISRFRQRTAIVNLGSALGLECNLSLFDFKMSIFYYKCYICEVLADVLKICC